MGNIKYKQLILLIIFTSIYLCLEAVSVILYFFNGLSPEDVFPWYIDFVYTILMIFCAVIIWEELHWAYLLVLVPAFWAALDFFWAMQINGEVLFNFLDTLMMDILFPVNFPFVHSLMVLITLVPSFVLIWKNCNKKVI